MKISAILQNFNITALNPMQEKAQEAFSEVADLQLISPTGSGKTLAYLLPLLIKLSKENPENHTQKMLAMIIVPTRELALQIEQVFKQLGSKYKINCCYGGHSVRIEKNNLSELPAVLVGTPGRIAYHIRNENMQVNTCKYLVLDEFDKSLEAGFHDEMEYILKKMPRLEKKVLCSATLISNIPGFVKMNKPVVLDFTYGIQQPISGMQLKQVRVLGDDKLEALLLLIGSLKDKSAIVFCNHRDAVNRISEQLVKLKIIHGFYHGGLEQIDREKTLIKLRNKTIQLLVSTDLAARGLDIPEIDVVIHYQLPLKEDAMIHRNGRTARMEAKGEVYFLLDENDHLPVFLESKPDEFKLPESFQMPNYPQWKTLFIKAGKKDKINKMDIVGMLLQKGKLEKDELGKIEVLDHVAYAAIKANKFKEVLLLVQSEKLKGRKIRMEEAS